MGVLTAVFIFGILIFIITELHRKGHHFYVTNHRVIREFKFLSKKSSQATFDLITGAVVDQNLMERIFNIGDLKIKTASGVPVTFRGVSEPEKIKKIIVQSKHKDKTGSNNGLDEKYKCEKCDKLFETDKDLYIHIGRIHEREKFECEKCGEKFDTEKGLHIHTGKKHG